MITKNRNNNNTSFDILNNTTLSPTDKSKDIPKNNKQNLLNQTESLLNKKAIKENMPGYGNVKDTLTAVDKVLGVFTNDSLDPCDNNNRNPVGLDRHVLGNNKNNIQCNKGGNSFDSLLNNIKGNTVINNKLHNIEDYVLSTKKDIKKSLDKSDNDLSKKFGLDKITKSDTIKETKAIYKNMKTIGNTLKAKADMVSSLFPCNGNSPTSNNRLLNSSILSNVLTNGAPCNPIDITSMLTTLIKTGTFDTKGVINAVSNSFKNSNSGNITDKITVLGSVIKNSSDDLTDKDKVSTKGTHNNILKGINEENATSNSPTSDYKNINESLTTVDDRWNKDKDGNPDYTATKNNKTMCTLSEKTTLTLTPDTETDDVSPDDDKLNLLRIMANNTDNLGKTA